jgi:hypothetical protein
MRSDIRHDVTHHFGNPIYDVSYWQISVGGEGTGAGP